jgi:hypothetical protein
MPEVKVKFQKMKFTGYACYVFAAILTIMVAMGWTEEIEATKALIGTWLLAGSSLLTVNAGKRIGGSMVMNKMNQESGK